MAATWLRTLLTLFTVVAAVVFITNCRVPWSALGMETQDASPQPPSAPQWSFLAEKSSHYITIDRAYVRWLWWPFLAYLFWGMAYICDDYFVRTIEVISDRFQIPDDVAGATLMALGCNGPEMALNTISIFNPSDIGVGAVIGGEVFNVLVIIGTAMLATPDIYLPLRISKFSFFRDVLFYIISVMMLYSILQDGQISRFEALTLIAGAVVYSTTVATSSLIRRTCYNLQRSLAARFTRQSLRASGLSCGEMINNRETCRTTVRKSVNIAEVLNGPRATNGTRATRYSEYMEADDSDFENEAEEELIEAWAGARKCTDPFVGSVVGVKVDVRSRMMDRNNRVEERYMWLTDNALMVSTAVDPEFPVKQKGRASDMVYDTKHQMWHYGGIISSPDIVNEDSTKPQEARFATSHTDSLLRTVSRIPEKAEIPGLDEVPCEAIPLRNVLYCDPVPGAPKMFTLHVHQEDELGLGRLITVEFQCKDSLVHDGWVAALRQNLQNRDQHRGACADHPPVSESCGDILWKCVAWFQFPVKTLAASTIPDMDRPEMQHWYPVAFTMSMTWLAFFAYLVVTACDWIHEDFGISTGLLGFTIAAAGTSFPNVFSGMVVSRQGKTTMAIANSLGANVQNVFLALAVPWTIKTCFINHGPYPMPVQGLESQIAAIYITLMPVLLIYLCNNCTLPRWSGYVLLITYIVYLIIALGQQSTGCMKWPLSCMQ